MSAVKRLAKISLFLFTILVLLIVGGSVYFYMNMNEFVRGMAEQVASNALGVDVTIGEVDIQLNEMKVVTRDIAIANPQGYTKPYAVNISGVTVALEDFSEELLTFAMIGVDGTKVNLEVKPKGTNLGDIKKKLEARSKTVEGQKPTADQVADVEKNKADIKVVVKNFALTGAELTPSVTLLKSDLGVVTVPDIYLQGIGEKENGILAREAVAQIMNSVLQEVNKTANKAGFLEGLPLAIMNDIGVSTLDVFQKNLKKSYDDDVNKFKQGVEGLKNMFQ